MILEDKLKGIQKGFKKASEAVDNLSYKANTARPYLTTIASGALGTVSAGWVQKTLEGMVGYYIPEAATAVAAGAALAGTIAVAENQGLKARYQGVWNRFNDADHKFYDISKSICSKLHIDLYDKWDMVRDICGNKASRAAPFVLSIGAFASQYGPESPATGIAGAFGLTAAVMSYKGERPRYQPIRFGGKFKEYFGRKKSFAAATLALLALGISGHSALDGYKPNSYANPKAITQPAYSPKNLPAEPKPQESYKRMPEQSNLAKEVLQSNSSKYCFPVDGGKMGDTYIIRDKHPITMKENVPHSAVDIRAPIGTPVKAVESGRVIYCKNYSGYGNVVAVQHNNGVISMYAHLNKMNVNIGDEVNKCRQIGTVGDTGWDAKNKRRTVTGPHLHLEFIENNLTQNPLKYLTQPRK